MSNEKRFGIHYAPLSKEIQVGQLNKAGNLFVGNKQTVTDQCIGAVAEFVESNYDGDVVFTYPNAGIKIEVKVTHIEKDATK